MKLPNDEKRQNAMKNQIIKEIVLVLEKIEDESVLFEIKSIILAIFKHYTAGTWGH